MLSRVRRTLPPRPASGAELASLGWNYLRACVRIDTRSLAVFRICIGLIVVVEVLLRARNFSLFYTEGGLIPQAVATGRTGESAFSVYFYTTDSTVIAVLFAIQILVALLLVVGYRTRTATVLTFLLMVSLDHHNPIVLSYADTLLRLLLFWAIFLPLGERWSIDAVHADREPRQTVATFATALALGQMCYMYVRNGIHKLEGDAWLDGTATPTILARDDFTFLLGEYTHHMTPLLELGTYLWTGMMLFGFLLFFAPGRLRYPLLPLYFGGHALFALTVRIGMFPYVAMAGLLLFIPPQFWRDGDRLLGWSGIETTRLRTQLSRLTHSGDYAPQFELFPEQFRTDFYNILLGIIVVTIALMLVVGGLQFVGVVSDDTNHDREVRAVAATFSIDQPDWTVFAPNPGTTDRYYVFPAETESGDLVDVYNERNLTWDRPGQQLQHQYGTYRERFYMNTIRRSSSDDDPPKILADHLCERWEEEHGESLVTINMWVVEEDVTMDAIASPDDRERNARFLHTYSCEGDEDGPILDFPPDGLTG